MSRVALITGITGQDGAYLAALLLEKGYTVHGLKRPSSMDNTARIAGLLQAQGPPSGRLFLHPGEMRDAASLTRIVARTKPQEIYNLAAQSHVGLSFDCPSHTADVNGLGAQRLLEAVRALGRTEATRFYQASTSELFGGSDGGPSHEGTPFHPRSPYATSKLFAHWTTVNYRRSQGIYACNGILFNHESPLRAEVFVTRRITRAMTRVAVGLQADLSLGNLDARRDWGHARDYVEAQWRMLQQEEPDDFVIATGEQRSVRDFVDRTAAALGMILEWTGEGIEERARVSSIGEGIAADRARPLLGRTVVRVDPARLRPADVPALVGDSTKARERLGWAPRTSFEELVDEMVRADLESAMGELGKRAC
jgi:GDPmannose 4,6-dehydratase